MKPPSICGIMGDGNSSFTLFHSAPVSVCSTGGGLFIPADAPLTRFKHSPAVGTGLVVGHLYLSFRAEQQPDIILPPGISKACVTTLLWLVDRISVIFVSKSFPHDLHKVFHISTGFSTKFCGVFLSFTPCTPVCLLRFGFWFLVFGIRWYTGVYGCTRICTHISLLCTASWLTRFLFALAFPLPAGLYRLFSPIALFLIGSCIQVDLFADKGPGRR